MDIEPSEQGSQGLKLLNLKKIENDFSKDDSDDVLVESELVLYHGICSELPCFELEEHYIQKFLQSMR